jgi:hypothetical protein
MEEQFLGQYLGNTVGVHQYITQIHNTQAEDPMHFLLCPYNYLMKGEGA